MKSIMKKLFGEDDDVLENDKQFGDDVEKIIGKIIYLAEEEGWGFISSHELKFTRIFFYWTGLEQDTLHFTKLEKGMKVKFHLKEVEGRGWRAINIEVVD